MVVVDANGAGAENGGAELGGVAVQADVGNVRGLGADPRRGAPLGGVDIAYLNAGVTTGEEDITKVTDEQYRRIMSVNVDGIVFGTRAVVPELVARGGGAVVATSSLAGIVAFAGRPDVHVDEARGGGLRALGGAAPRRAPHHDQRHLPGPRGHTAHRRRDPRQPGRGRVPPHRARGGRRGRSRLRPRRRDRPGGGRAARDERRWPIASVVLPARGRPAWRAGSRRSGWPTRAEVRRPNPTAERRPGLRQLRAGRRRRVRSSRSR